jgi:hypothetical protein
MENSCGQRFQGLVGVSILERKTLIDVDAQLP